MGLSFLELLAIAVQSTANTQKPEVVGLAMLTHDMGGAGHSNAYSHGIFAGLARDERGTRQTCLYLSWDLSSLGGQRALSHL